MLLFFFSLSLSSEPLVSKHEKSHHLRLIDYYVISTQSSKSRDDLIFHFVRSSVQKKEKKKRGGGGKGKVEVLREPLVVFMTVMK